MNVREMLEEIPKRYPLAQLATKWDTPPYEYFVVGLENGWVVSVGYSSFHRSSNRFYPDRDPTDAVTVEIAIFRPSGKWFIAEGMSADPGDRTGVLGWQDSDELFQILDYISQMESTS